MHGSVPQPGETASPSVPVKTRDDQSQKEKDWNFLMTAKAMVWSHWKGENNTFKTRGLEKCTRVNEQRITTVWSPHEEISPSCCQTSNVGLTKAHQRGYFFLFADNVQFSSHKNWSVIFIGHDHSQYHLPPPSTDTSGLAIHWCCDLGSNYGKNSKRAGSRPLHRGWATNDSRAKQRSADQNSAASVVIYNQKSKYKRVLLTRYSSLCISVVVETWHKNHEAILLFLVYFTKYASISSNLMMML